MASHPYGAEGAAVYRQTEENFIAFGSRKHYGDLLRELSGSFGRPISVLDVGCGTGRFFHCLRNADRLLGIDVSRPMLDEARNPVKKEEITIGSIELLQADIHTTSLPQAPFDLIYSVGVLGEETPFDLALCEKFHGLLKPGGRLFMKTVDIHSRLQRADAFSPYLKRALLNKFFTRLPKAMRESLNRKTSSNYMTRSEIETIFKASGFSDYRIERYRHQAGTGWQGAHFDCFAKRD
jgi:ubiquinone/menaquinone biosynthesis C-methylase UbiE